MSKDILKKDIFSQMRDSGQHYREEPPVKTWSRIETKLDYKQINKKSSYIQKVYNAAMILLLIGVIGVGSFYLGTPSEIDQQANEVYAFQIEELQSKRNTYPIYNVHKLRAAYQNMYGQGEVQLFNEEKNNIFRPFKDQGF